MEPLAFLAPFHLINFFLLFIVNGTTDFSKWCIFNLVFVDPSGQGDVSVPLLNPTNKALEQIIKLSLESSCSYSDIYYKLNKRRDLIVDSFDNL